METLKPSRPSRSKRREAILDAAIECVLRFGFHGASMSDISAAADIGVGVIYRHFSNKEAIIEAIVERNIAELRSHVTPLKSQTLPIAIHAMAKEVEKFVIRQHDRRHSALMLEIYAEAARNDKIEAIVRKYAEIERDLARSFVMTMASSALPESKLNARVDLLRIVADGLLVHGLYTNKKTGRSAITEEIRQVFTYILDVH